MPTPKKNSTPLQKVAAKKDAAAAKRKQAAKGEFAGIAAKGYSSDLVNNTLWKDHILNNNEKAIKVEPTEFDKLGLSRPPPNAAQINAAAKKYIEDKAKSDQANLIKLS